MSLNVFIEAPEFEVSPSQYARLGVNFEITVGGDVSVPPNSQYVDMEQLILDNAEEFGEVLAAFISDKLPVFEGEVGPKYAFRMEPKYYYQTPDPA